MQARDDPYERERRERRERERRERELVGEGGEAGDERLSIREIKDKEKEGVAIKVRSKRV